MVGNFAFDTKEACQSSILVDTGAGPSCVRKDMVPPEELEKLAPATRKCLAANGTPIPTLGVTKIWVKLGNYVALTEVLVCNDLPCPILLGTSFLNHHIWSISPMTQRIETASGCTLPILGRGQVKNFPPTKVQPFSIDYPTRHRDRKLDRIKVSTKTVIPANSQKAVTVTCGGSGTVLLEPKKGSIAEHSMSMTHGIATVRARVPFRVLVANFSDQPITLPKRMVLGKISPHQAVVQETNIPVGQVLSLSTEKPNPVDFSDLHRGASKGNTTAPEELVDLMELPELPADF